MSSRSKTEKFGNIVLLAKSFDGYQNLLKIVSEANLNGRNKKARIDLPLLTTYAKDLIILI